MCVNGCDRPAYRRGRCSPCWWAHRKATNPPCTVEGCDKTRTQRDLCGTHYARYRRNGTTDLIDQRLPDDLITYRGLHLRITRDRGRAAEQACADCGGQARDWAYNHSGVRERADIVSGYVMLFSTDVTQYDALCRSCHLHRDRAAG